MNSLLFPGQGSQSVGMLNSIKDLNNLNFASRQDGSGTKIYFDYLLKKNYLWTILLKVILI